MSDVVSFRDNAVTINRVPENLVDGISSLARAVEANARAISDIANMVNIIESAPIVSFDTCEFHAASGATTEESCEPQESVTSHEGEY